MLHELLVALKGYPGSIFCLNAEHEIQVVDNLPFCHPGERVVLNRICRLATSHYRLIEFIRCHGDQTWPCTDDSLTFSSSPLKHGLYLRSLCVSLDEAFIVPYVKHIVHLESEILADPLLTVSFVQYSLEKYQYILPALVRLIDDVTSRRAHGCQILELIHSHSSSGIPNVSTVLKRVQRICHAVLIRHLTDWLLYGVLRDPYEEFFITQHSMTSLNTGTIETPFKDNKVDRFCYRLNVDMLPSYISVDVAKIILFVGESIRRQMSEQGDDLNPSNDFNKLTGSVNILQDKRDIFAKQLFDWQQNEDMDIGQFEIIIDNVRSCVAQHLWTLIVEKGDLSGHLSSLKDHYLLGRGDLYTAFIERADAFLNLPPTSNTQEAISRTFETIGRRTLPEDDSYFENFNLILDLNGGSSSGSMSTDSNRLRLNYNAPWPIHTIFTSEVIDELNGLFQFLLNVKRVQLRLHQCWALRMHLRHLGMPGDVDDRNGWHLRTCMAFIVDNLQYYLQVDVLESQFNILMKKIKGTRDFQEVEFAFHAFMANIRMQSFLLMKPVFKLVVELLDLCSSYCAALQLDQWTLSATSGYGNGDQNEFERNYQMEFRRHSKVLIKLLSNIRTHQVRPHVAQLVTRLNFNQYFVDDNNDR